MVKVLRHVIIKWEDLGELADLVHDNHYEDVDELKNLPHTRWILRDTTTRVRLLVTDAERQEIATPLHLEVEMTFETDDV